MIKPDGYCRRVYWGGRPTITISDLIDWEGRKTPTLGEISREALTMEVVHSTWLGGNKEETMEA